MNTKVRKGVILTVKLLVAASLLTWVISQVHWDNYVQDSKGNMYAVAGKPAESATQIDVVKGRLWWQTVQKGVAVSDYAPTGDQAHAGKTLTFADVERLGVRVAIDKMDKWLLALSCLGFLLSTLIIAVRWWFLLRLQDIYIKLWEAVRLTFLGQFFNYVVPGTVGGDLVKAYYVSKHTHKKAAVLVSVFVDRVLGMTELVILGGVMVIVVLASGQAKVEDMIWPIRALVLAAALVVAALVFILSPRVRAFFHLEKIYQRLPIAHHIAAAGEAATLYRKRLPGLVKAIAITLGSQTIWISSVALIGMSLHLDAKIFTYFVCVPVIYIIGAVPVAPGGLGLIEAMYRMFFATSNASQVIVMALLARLIPMFWGIPGAVVAVTGPKIPKAKDMEAELNAEEENPQISQRR